MKCIKKGDTVLRLPDSEAHNAVREEGFQYCPKSVYKKHKKDLIKKKDKGVSPLGSKTILKVDKKGG